jgi:DNA-binding response OmpR family regulator
MTTPGAPEATAGKRVLVVEDDPEIARLVEIHLADQGCRVELARDGDEGWEKARAEPFDLVVLDLMLPGLDGLEICRRLRARETYPPVLMLTARSGEVDRVLGLETGADDYLTKPFSVRELVARVKAIFRRAAMRDASGEGADPAQRLSVGGLDVDPVRRRVEVDGREVHLTAREFDLLYEFVRHPGRVFTRSQLLDRVWGYGHDGYEHTVNSHINRLRGKIEEDPGDPRHVLTVWGVGYKLAEP